MLDSKDLGQGLLGFGLRVFEVYDVVRVYLESRQPTVGLEFRASSLGVRQGIDSFVYVLLVHI